MRVKIGKPKSKILSRNKNSPKSSDKFYIAGVGASAGGLEALEQFLGNVVENSGIAYVIIQHLDPTQKGMLPELLQRITGMKVYQAKDRMKVEPDCVYVIPPNKSMSILKGALLLFEPLETRGLRLPIDFFLRSLADDLQEFSIGVILSGMGSDGCIGLRAIKEKGGIVLVQDPSTSKYESMPRNAIDAVLPDIIAPADLLPKKLLPLVNNITPHLEGRDIEIKDPSALEKIIILLRSNTGNDFSLYKRNTVYRRIERRMSVHKIDKIPLYVRFLQENPKEIQILFKELMIGVTNFFRDPRLWEFLKSTVIPDKIAKLKEGTIMRAWIPGCSTGEEAYSFAIVFKEVIEKINPRSGITLQIFATDLDSDAINFARNGLYPLNISSDVSADRLDRYFISSEEGYRVKTQIREMIVFAQHNVILHPPFTRIDFLSCRNLLIYMNSDLQNKLIGLFYYSINPEGIMVLGTAETVGAKSYLFKTIDSRLKVYERTNSGHLPELYDFPSSFSRTKPSIVEKQAPDISSLNIQALADQLLLQHFSPSGVLVNENGDIIYIHGHTGKYLEPAVGKANLNVFAMLREGLRKDFPHAFRQVVMKKEAIVLHNLKIGTNGGTQIVDVHIEWINKPELLNGTVMIIFTDIKEYDDINLYSKKSRKGSESIRESELESELQRTREEIQNTLEEMQTSQEELKSTNEELQSTNEELQSTNEELTTSKEEMQSLNEELQTVNAELQSKVDEFSRVNNDMKNLLNSTEIATLFLDKELNIRRYTVQATKIFKLIKSDIGRPFTDQASKLIYPELADDAMEVLSTLVFMQKEIPTKDGRWFSVRIMPYRTLDDRIEGLVITFINVTDLKKNEAELLKTEQMNRILLNSSSDIIILLSSDWKIMEFNNEAEIYFGKKRRDCINMNFIQIFIPEKDQKKTEKKLEKLISEGVDCKIQMHVKAAGGNVAVAEWLVNISFNEFNLAELLILSIKKIAIP